MWPAPRGRLEEPKFKLKAKGKVWWWKGGGERCKHHHRRGSGIFWKADTSQRPAQSIGVWPQSWGKAEKKKTKKKTGLQYLRKWSLSFDLHPLQRSNYNPSIQAQTLNIPKSASELGNRVKWVKCEISGLTARKATISLCFKYVHSQQLGGNTFV